MNWDDAIDITAKGTVLLGDEVCCDGFRRDRRWRIQSHTHKDHMGGFGSSLGRQDVLMSSATRALLVAELNAGLETRENIIPIRLIRLRLWLSTKMAHDWVTQETSLGH